MFGANNSSPYSPPRPLGQDYRRSSSNEQGKCLALIYGRQRVGCEFISDVFDIMSSAITAGGKGSRVEGYNYYASFLVAVCHGPVAALHDVYFNGDPIFTEATQQYPISLTLLNNVVTVQTRNAHGLSSGQTIVMYNVQQQEFNGEFLITVVSTTQFQYTVPGASIPGDTGTAVSGLSIYYYIKLDPIYAGGADSTVFTIPDFGTATIYWGTLTQTPDAYTLAASGIVHPPYLGVCYIVFRQLYLGFNQTSVQNIEVVVERTPSFPGQSVPAHAGLNGDCNPACIYADMILSPRYGLGCDPNDDFDAAGIDAAAEQFYADNLAFSPIINRPAEMLSTITDMVVMADAAPVLDGQGRLSLAMQRAGTIVAETVAAANLTELPEFTPEDWSAVVNQTYLNFTNRDSGWQDDFAVWNDTAGIYAKDRAEPQMLDKQFITNSQTAALLAGVAGQLAALPKQDGKLSLAFSTALWCALKPGAGFTYDYSDTKGQARNNGIYRVTSRSIEDPAKPVFTLEISIDRSYLYTLAQEGSAVIADIPPSGAPVPELVDIAPFANYAIVELPQPLCPDAKPAVGALIARDSATLTAAQLYLGRNYVFTGSPPESYFVLESITVFALYGQLAAAFPAAAALTTPANALPAESADWPVPFPLAAGLQVQLLGVDLILPDVSDFDALAAGVILVAGNEFMAVAEQAMTSAGNYTLTVIRGAFGTTIADHAAGDEVFIIPRAGLAPLQHAHFRAGNTAEFKVTLSNTNVSDAEAFNVAFIGTYWNFPAYLQQPPAGM